MHESIDSNSYDQQYRSIANEIDAFPPAYGPTRADVEAVERGGLLADPDSEVVADD